MPCAIKTCIGVSPVIRDSILMKQDAALPNPAEDAQP